MISIDEIKIHTTIPPKFKPGSIVAYDTEWFGMEKKKLHRPTTGEFACMSISDNGQDVYIIQDKEYARLCWIASEDAKWRVFQNAKFDITQLRRLFKLEETPKIWDTLYCDKILWSGYFDDFSLKAMVRRYFQLKMDKEVREEFITANTMTDEMIRYAAYDAVLTWHLAMKQMRTFTEADYRAWNEFDLPALWAVLDMKGVLIDQDKWNQIANMNEFQAEEMKTHFPFNPNSPGQVKSYFKEKEMITLRSTDEEHLSRLPNNEMARKILEYRKIAKRASTYGRSWLEDVIEPDGRVYADYSINGAETSRFSCSKPNMQNIPTRATPVYRECIIAAPKYVLIIGDLSQQEPRVSAELCQDKILIQLFKDGRDIYCTTGTEIYKEKIEKSDPRRKNILKPAVLGIDYGLSAESLAEDVGISVDEANRIIYEIFQMFPKKAAWIKKQQRRTNYVETLVGRKIYLNPYNYQCPRNTINAPVQGSASEIIKRAMYYLHTGWKLEWGEFGLVAVIHDELVVEAPEEFGGVIRDFVYDCLVRGAEYVTPNVPAGAEVFIGKNWACKH